MNIFIYLLLIFFSSLGLSFVKTRSACTCTKTRCPIALRLTYMNLCGKCRHWLCTVYVLSVIDHQWSHFPLLYISLAAVVCSYLYVLFAGCNCSKWVHCYNHTLTMFHSLQNTSRKTSLFLVESLKKTYWVMLMDINFFFLSFSILT